LCEVASFSFTPGDIVMGESSRALVLACMFYYLKFFHVHSETATYQGYQGRYALAGKQNNI
jgi:hypothetical protein